jgi:hypothetical protein
MKMKEHVTLALPALAALAAFFILVRYGWHPLDVFLSGCGGIMNMLTYC